MNVKGSCEHETIWEGAQIQLEDESIDAPYIPLKIEKRMSKMKFTKAPK